MATQKTDGFQAARLAELRKQKGLSRGDLALLADVSPETVRSVELGRTPSGRVARSLAEALGVPAEQLSPIGEDATLGDLRRLLGRTQRQLAEAIGVSVGMVSQTESGRYGARLRHPDLWAAAYEVTPERWARAWEAGRARHRHEIETRRRT
jgi:transcriptional regulator with XRE-family HTH domain